MNYYQISLLKFPLNPLIYRSAKPLKKGNIVEVELNKRKKIGVVLNKCLEPEFACDEVIGLKEEYFSKEVLEVAHFISNYYVCSLGDALGLFVPFGESAQKSVTIDSKVKLSREQQKAYDFIESKSASLLFGDTGSGKTEIYIKLIEDAINSNKTALLLMPEIGLTPQMQKRLKRVFGSLVAIWHSKVTKKKKEEILKALESGEVKVIAGTRSALFLPLCNLGLIVVDEEHDDSYKSNQRPRYNARDLALLIGKKRGAKVVLGSATPTLGSYKNLPTFRLKKGYFDSKKRFIFQDSISEINEQILSKIEEHKNSQVIVFLPTRANFKYLTCSSCGGSVECPYCSVGMSLHVDKNLLRCHYCSYSCAIPSRCPSCSKSELRANRIGTSEVLKILRERFPAKVIEKFDRDEINSTRKLNKILKEFNEKKIDILVGTQMLSKGHDYHGVTLSVIMGLDSMLNMPDFRARERALSLFLQVAGRAGRSRDSEVLLQSKNCDFFREFVDDYEEFLKDELKQRGELYPPFVKLLKVLISHKNDLKASEMLNEVERVAKNFKEIEVVGSGRANIEKIANKYRYNLLARAKNPKELLRFAHSIKELKVEIDIDPLSFS